MMHDQDWRHRAVCRDEDPELFFPVGNSGPALVQTAEAKAVCRRCPVASECLEWALENRQYDGVWGGMSEDERSALKRRKSRPSQSPATDSLSGSASTLARTLGMSQQAIARAGTASRYNRGDRQRPKVRVSR